MMRTLHNTFWAAMCVVALGVPAARAQQQQTQDQQQQPPAQQQQTPDQGATPIPAYHSPFATSDENSDANQQSQPDNRSLSGAQELSPLLLPTRSYWQPQVNVYGTADSNPIDSPSGSSWEAGASVSGRVDIHRISGNSALDVSYNGGAEFSSYNGAGTGIVQALSFTDKITFRRWSISFFDQLRYLPGSDFGFGGLGGLGGSGLGGSAGLEPVFGPGQTILTGDGQNLANSFVTEVDYALSPRASLTLVGGYYLLHNFDGGFLNSTNPNFRGALNYEISHRDTIAGLYTFSGFRYSDSIQSFDTHTVQVSYGHVLTGRLAFQVAAGPEIVISRVPITSSDGETTTLNSTTQLYLSLSTSLTWTGERNRVGLTYYRGASSGSGVLAGSIGDTVSGTLTREVSRTFVSGISGGYSRNEGVGLVAGAPFTQTYDYWFGSANFSHPVGRSLALSLSYLVQYQQNPASAVSCVGPTCGTSFVRNLISFGVGWHERPLLF